MNFIMVPWNNRNATVPCVNSGTAPPMYLLQQTLLQGGLIFPTSVISYIIICPLRKMFLPTATAERQEWMRAAPPYSFYHPKRNYPLLLPLLLLKYIYPQQQNCLRNQSGQRFLLQPAKKTK